MDLHQLLIRTALLARDIQNPSRAFLSTLSNWTSQSKRTSTGMAQLPLRMLMSYPVNAVGRYYHNTPPGDIAAFIRDNDLQVDPAAIARSAGTVVPDTLAFNREFIFTLAINAGQLGVLDTFACVEDFFVKLETPVGVN